MAALIVGAATACLANDSGRSEGGGSAPAPGAEDNGPSSAAKAEDDGQHGARWAVGIGVGVAYLPDYVGADEGRLLPLPFPYVEYESRFFEADRSGLSGLLPLRDDLRLEVNVGGALPVNSSDNHAREGMHDLGWIGEIGPMLSYRAFESDDAVHRLSVELPVRAAFALDWAEVEHIGWTSGPAIAYRHQREVAGGRLRLTTTVGPLFNSGQYNAYFYSVPTRDARSDRPQYDADAGYSGARLGLGVSYRIGDWWFGAFGRYINLRGAVFENSPLVRSKDYLSAGIGTAWVFAQSKEK